MAKSKNPFAKFKSRASPRSFKAHSDNRYDKAKGPGSLGNPFQSRGSIPFMQHRDHQHGDEEEQGTEQNDQDETEKAAATAATEAENQEPIESFDPFAEAETQPNQSVESEDDEVFKISQKQKKSFKDSEDEGEAKVKAKKGSKMEARDAKDRDDDDTSDTHNNKNAASDSDDEDDEDGSPMAAGSPGSQAGGSQAGGSQAGARQSMPKPKSRRASIMSNRDAQKLGQGFAQGIPQLLDYTAQGNLDTLLTQNYKGDIDLFYRAITSYVAKKLKDKAFEDVNDLTHTATASQACWNLITQERLEQLRKLDKEKTSRFRMKGGKGDVQEAEDEDAAEEQLAAEKKKGRQDSATGDDVDVAADQKKTQMTKKSMFDKRDKRTAQNIDNQKQVKQLSAEQDCGLVQIKVVEGRGIAGLNLNGLSNAGIDAYMLQDEAMECNSYNSETQKSVDPWWNEEWTFAWKSEDDVIVMDVTNTSRLHAGLIGRVVVPVLLLTMLQAEADSKAESKSNKSSKRLFKKPELAEPNDVVFERWMPLHQTSAEVGHGGWIYVSIKIERKPAGSNSPKNALAPTNINIPVSVGGEVSVWVGTWNVGNAPPPDDLSSWIPIGPHDVYAVAVQECKYSPRLDYNTCRDDWFGTLNRHFGPQYTMMKYHSLWEIRLSIFVANHLVPRVHNITFHTERTGIGNLLGNKGGVVTALDLDHSTLCVVNVHLAAHQDKIAARNANVRQICKLTKVGRHYGNGSRIDICSQFDHLVFMGDMNYRLNYGEHCDKTPTEEIFKQMVDVIEENKHSQLLKTDQLLLEKKKKRVFYGFQEGQIEFPPTFKVERKKILQYLNQRSPAWCDRVLWRTGTGAEEEFVQTSLMYVPEITTSDHKPVSATFKMVTCIMPTANVSWLGECTMTFSGVTAKDLLSVESRAIQNETNRDEVKRQMEDLVGATAKSKSKNTKISQTLKVLKKTMRSSTTNPFIRVTAPFLAESRTSHVVKDTLNPAWADAKFKPWTLLYNNPSRLDREKIYVCVESKSAVGNSDTLGFGVVSLVGTRLSQHATRNKGRSVKVPFTAVLTYAGLPAGVLKGELVFNWSSWSKE